MENSQSVQHQPSVAQGLTLEPTNSKSKQIGSWKLLINLFARYPWLLLVGLLGMFAGGATLAVYSLGHVGHIEPEEPETKQVVVEKPIATPSQISNPTPLWMVAAIGLSCASGCLIVFRLFNRPAPQQKVRKYINRYQARVATKSRYERLEPRPPKNPPVFVPPPSGNYTPPKPSKTQPTVTVLPPEHSIHDHKNKESLADMMDLRKQSSLSALLRKN